MMEKKEKIKTILESLVDIYKHNSCANRDSQYSQFLEDISGKGKYFSVKTIMKLYSLGISYMENGRAGDENLYHTLRGLSRIIILKLPKLGERCREKMDYIYKRNWALLETL